MAASGFRVDCDKIREKITERSVEIEERSPRFTLFYLIQP
jgi:hypothetical protein